MNEKIKYLEMIQAVITRMANNSHQLKQWCMVSMAAGWGLMVKHDFSFCVFIGMSMLTFVFWYLSSYYLQCERLFRNMYDEVVRANDSNKTDSEHRNMFSLTPTSEDRKNVESIWSVGWGPTLRWFYLMLMGINLVFFLSTCTQKQEPMDTTPEYKNLEASTQENK